MHAGCAKAFQTYLNKLLWFYNSLPEGGHATPTHVYTVMYASLAMEDKEYVTLGHF